MELGILASEPSRWFFLDFFDEVPRKKAEKRKIFFENILKRTSLPEDARHGRVGRGSRLPAAGLRLYTLDPPQGGGVRGHDHTRRLSGVVS